MVSIAPLPRIVAAAASHVGRVRAENEDAWFVDVEKGILIVSDGIGGAQAGKEAATVVVSVLPQMVWGRLSGDRVPRSRVIRTWLQQDMLSLSQHLRQIAGNRFGLKGMGATVVLAVFRRNLVHLAHMGDSRAYLLRAGRLEQLTEDHSIVAHLVRRGRITQEEALTHPARGRLSRFVGMAGDVYADVRTVLLRKGDRLLLCTDGLTGMLDPVEVQSILTIQRAAQAACESLVAAANEAGGKDNTTVVVADWS